MKTVLNKTQRPLKIRLSKGKVLHLGPGKEGPIANTDEERDSVKKLVDAGEIEIFDSLSRSKTGGDASGPGRPGRRGHHPGFAVRRRGDR